MISERESLGESLDIVIKDGVTGKIKRHVAVKNGKCVDVLEEKEQKDIADFLGKRFIEKYAIRAMRRLV